MGNDEAQWLLIGLAGLLIFVLALWVGRYLRPKCRSCQKGRLIVVDEWFDNEKLRCDECGEEYWNLDL